MSTLYIRYPATGGSNGVSSLNGEVGAINLVAGSNITITPAGQNITIAGQPGTVTSVALALPNIFTVSGSPVTSSGTLTGSFNTQSANTVFSGPSTGSPATPTFRSLVSADIPSLSGIYVTQSEVGAANGVASLDGGGKVPIAQLPASVFLYQGTWDPSTNTPTLVDGTGVQGYVYWVSVAFAGPISGLNNPSMHNFQIGDLAIYNGTQWELTTPAAGVVSVNGLQGVVTLTQGNLTDAGTDGITVTNGTNAVWGTGTSLSQHVADTTHNGYLSSTDWNTFNSKQAGPLTGDVTTSGAAATISTNVVSNTKLAQMAAHTYKGNNTGSTANAIDVTSTQLTADLNLFSSTLQGLVPASGGGTTNFLRADGTFAAPTASAINSYYSGYFPNASLWQASSSSLIDGTNTGGNTLTTRQSSGITVTAAASNVCGLTFTPATSSSVYQVTAVLGLNGNTTGAANTVSMTDGTTVIQQRDVSSIATLGFVLAAITLSGIFVPGTTSPVTVKLQIAASSGTATIESDGSISPSVEWTIVQLQ